MSIANPNKDEVKAAKGKLNQTFVKQDLDDAILDDLSDVEHMLGTGLPRHEYANKVKQMYMLEGHLQCLWLANVDLGNTQRFPNPKLRPSQPLKEIIWL